MELLAGAMRVIQGNDFVCTACQVRPVGVDFDIGHEQAVVIVVVETFNHLECHGHRSTGGLRTAGAQVIDEAGDVFALTCVLPALANAPGYGEPLLTLLLT